MDLNWADVGIQTAATLIRPIMLNWIHRISKPDTDRIAEDRQRKSPQKDRKEGTGCAAFVSPATYPPVGKRVTLHLQGQGVFFIRWG